MESLLIFKLGRRARMLIALASAMAALAIVLLGVGSELPTVSANTLPPARAENATSAITYYIHLPFILHTPATALNWVDSFTSKKTGWIAAGDGCTGTYDTDDDVYRVTISSGHKGKSCIIWNSNPSDSPLYPFPRQFNGTFRVKVRRTSSNSYPLLYGFQFDTARDSSDTSGTRWALEAWPQATDTGCSEDRGFFWLSAQQYKSSTSHTDKYWSVDDADEDGCTSAIDRDQNDWNQMAAIREGSTIGVYINNFDADGDVDKTYHDDFTNVPTIVAKGNDPLGWVQMRLVSDSSSAVTVEFDRIEIRSDTTPPW